MIFRMHGPHHQVVVPHGVGAVHFGRRQMVPDLHMRSRYLLSGGMHHLETTEADVPE